MMQTSPDKPVSRKKERIFLFLVTAMLLVLFVRLFAVLQNNFSDVPQRLKAGTMVNLNGKHPAGDMRSMLEKGYYFDDKRDIDLIANTIAKGIKSGKGFDNIGDLNKKQFNVNADEAFAEGGNSFKQRVVVSRALLGYTGDDSVRFEQEAMSPPALPSTTDIGMGGPAISGMVFNKKEPVSGGAGKAAVGIAAG
jgi:hypothetical protein